MHLATKDISGVISPSKQRIQSCITESLVVAITALAFIVKPIRVVSEASTIFSLIKEAFRVYCIPIKADIDVLNSGVYSVVGFLVRFLNPTSLETEKPTDARVYFTSYFSEALTSTTNAILYFIVTPVTGMYLASPNGIESDALSSIETFIVTSALSLSSRY